MTTQKWYPIGLLLFLECSLLFFRGLPAYSQTTRSEGIQPLLQLSEQSIHSLLPLGVQPLINPEEIEPFLEKLEGRPPDWARLQHPNITEQSERLFDFNRKRDSTRANKEVILQQPVAFLWGGILRYYVPEHRGFSIALGPELTQTSWGIIRFKPVDLPNTLVAIPPPELRPSLLARHHAQESIEIIVVCIGTFIADESLIYGFSHDGDHAGMILPVVSVHTMLYILKP
ncbi:MAG: hypothetical protein OEZ57_01780 [Nitrospirota bacterium]|nr:hypothetical protein [Nitrospirota bacterium]MDH5585698.1 hypothetical protein [Nitrospirota bacterium]MDH5773631.1 hypothetical protein [Nitrospirota bacterium]